MTTERTNSQKRRLSQFRREADVAHLRKNGFVEVDRQTGGSITCRYGSRANAIIASYREAVGKKGLMSALELQRQCRDGSKAQAKDEAT